MKVLITGSDGFIGKNLRTRLEHIDIDVELLLFDKNIPFSYLEDNINKADYIFHLAGENRPKDDDDFYKNNAKLTTDLVNLIKNNNSKCKVIYTSSIQAAKDNDYGKSKKIAEDALLKLAESNDIFIFRLDNVFGKWSNPNYNSVVATFCYNINHNLPITVNDPAHLLTLIYIDDIIDEFTDILKGKLPRYKENSYYKIKPSYEITLGELADRLYIYYENLSNIKVPSTGDPFTKKMFSTFMSYVKPENLIMNPKINSDDRGSFTELIKTDNSGQISVSISKKGVIRGNHFHDTKMENFIVVKGSALLRLRHMITNELIEYSIGDLNHEIVIIPPGYTHTIENLGDELILILWCNEIFDENTPDTYYEEV